MWYCFFLYGGLWACSEYMNATKEWLYPGELDPPIPAPNVIESSLIAI